MFTAAQFTITKTWKQPKFPSTDNWKRRYTYNGILLREKKNEILPFAATWMDLENVTLSEINQRKKDKYCMMSLICGI